MKGKRKKVFVIICFCLGIFSLSGCVKKNNVEENPMEVTKQEGKEQNMKKKQITKEDLMREYHITEEELEGVDVVSFLNMYDFELGVTEEEYVRDMLEFFKEEFNDAGYMNYGYMLDEPVNTPLTQSNVNSIVRLVWQVNAGEGVEALAFDFENERIYEGGRIEDFDNSELIGVADDAIKEKVIQVIEEYDIYSWKDCYEGGSTEGTTANYNWQMAIEFSDGTIYQTRGRGLGDKARPDNMYDFIKALRECEPENTNVSE